MKYSVNSKLWHSQSVDCIVIGVFGTQQLTPSALHLNKIGKNALSRIQSHGELSGKIGASLLLHDYPHLKAPKVLLLDCGNNKTVSPSQFRTIAQALARELARLHIQSALMTLTEIPVEEKDTRWKIMQLTKALSTAFYVYDQTKSKAIPKPSCKHLIWHAHSQKEEQTIKATLPQALAINNGMTFAKDLANLPGNICTPSYLAKQAQGLAKKYSLLKCQILSEADMKKLKMGSLLSVSQGSKQPAKTIILHYQGSSKREKPIVLIGKGVTFDTGGISLKPGLDMDQMKFDMCGAASVMGTMQVIAELKLKCHVIGVIGAVENFIGNEATKPGDIVTSMSGQTIEILNTDAEGRLVLCDLLTYVTRFKPKLVIDIATLTGMMQLTLADQACGVFTNDIALQNAITEAGDFMHDRAWPMPLWDEYHDLLKSNFADVANIGGRLAGSITAACFLSRFVNDYRWAHLDIAGIAWLTGGKKGATGRPIPLLVEFILREIAKQ